MGDQACYAKHLMKQYEHDDLYNLPLDIEDTYHEIYQPCQSSSWGGYPE